MSKEKLITIVLGVALGLVFFGWSRWDEQQLSQKYRQMAYDRYRPPAPAATPPPPPTPVPTAEPTPDPRLAAAIFTLSDTSVRQPERRKALEIVVRQAKTSDALLAVPRVDPALEHFRQEVAASLGAKNWHARLWAARALVAAGHRDGVTAAIELLGNIGAAAAEAYSLLRVFSQDKDTYVSAAAREAVRKLEAVGVK